MKVSVYLGCALILVVGLAAYQRLQQYEVDDLTGQAVRLIPHDVARISASWIAHKEQEAILANMRAQIDDVIARARAAQLHAACEETRDAAQQIVDAEHERYITWNSTSDLPNVPVKDRARIRAQAAMVCK